jgi:hypothetical protein
LNFILVPLGKVSLSGTVLDPMGNGIPGQWVYLTSSGSASWLSVQTDSAGHYFFQLAPGNYDLNVSGNNVGLSATAPQDFLLRSRSPLSLAQDTVMDIPLPAKRVTVHVQNPHGEPVADVDLMTSATFNYSLTLGSLPADGYSFYPYNCYVHPKTDSNGDATLWLFPIDPSQQYSITATPPADSDYAIFTISDVHVTSDMTIIVVLDFAVPPNQPPVADAGENVFIVSEDLSSTVISGTARDNDPDDILEYRWMEREAVLEGWTPVGIHGECFLDLRPLPFTIGQHTLTLEVRDGKATASVEMILTVANSAPNVVASGEGTYEIRTEVVLTATGSDFDGDELSYRWVEGTNTICSGRVPTEAGGTPGVLPACRLTDLSLGDHQISVEVSDGINDLVISQVSVKIIDDLKPTLAPVDDRGILWPPNHAMVLVTIDPKASDNSGLPVSLNVVVTSNEPQNGLGDGDTAPDWTGAAIDPNTGIITLKLRAERSGSGNGRVYTIAIIATDLSGNSGEASVRVLVPHDKSSK